MTNPRNRVSLAEAETILGRPCPHSWRTRPDYCRACSNQVAQWKITQRERAGFEPRDLTKPTPRQKDL